MNCLVVAATQQEIAPFLKHYVQSNKKNHIEFDLNVLVTGVGMVNTVYKLTQHLENKSVDVIIMVGIAGSFTKDLELGSVVAVKNDYFGDLGVMEGKQWVDSFDLKLIGKNEFPYKNKGLKNTNREHLKRSKLPLVNAVTVNQISTNKTFIQNMVTNFDAQIETMEGAGLHFVALQQEIPFIQIRGISNYVGVRNKSQWKFKEAIQNSNNVLVQLFESL